MRLLDWNEIFFDTCGDGKSLLVDCSGILPMLAFVESGDEPTCGLVAILGTYLGLISISSGLAYAAAVKALSPTSFGHRTIACY